MEGWLNIRKERIRGFEGSSGSLGIFFQNIKVKDSRSQGVKKRRVQGFEESSEKLKKLKKLKKPEKPEKPEKLKKLKNPEKPISCKSLSSQSFQGKFEGIFIKMQPLTYGCY